MTRSALVWILAVILSLSFVHSAAAQEDQEPVRRSIVLENATVGEALRFIADAFDLSLAVGSLPEERVSLRLLDATADEALAALANTIGYEVRRSDGGVVRLVSVAGADSAGKRSGQAESLRRLVVGDFTPELDEVIVSLRGQTLEIERPSPRVVILQGTPSEVEFAYELVNTLRIRQTTSLEPQTTPLETRLYQLGTASGVGVVDALKTVVLDESERAAYDEESHTLTVTASREALSRVERWLEARGRELPQIEIEVRMVEVRTSELERAGFDWQLRAGVTGGALPSTFPLRAMSDNVRYLPSATEAGTEDPGFTFSFFDAQDLSVFLELLKETGTGKVLSRPKVVTLHNHEAIFESLTTLRIPTFTRNESFDTTTVSGVETVAFGTSLRVRPRVDKDRNIYLAIEPAVSKLDGVSEDGFPIVSERKMKADVLLADGETLVLGGLVREKQVETVTSVPLLGEIPLLKYLFQHTATETVSTELLIFITPRLLPPVAVRRDSMLVDGVWLPARLGGQLAQLRLELKAGVPSRVHAALGKALSLDAEALAAGVDLLSEIRSFAIASAFGVRLASARFVLVRRPALALDFLSHIPDGRRIAVGLLSDVLAPHMRYALASQLAHSPGSGALVEKAITRALAGKAPRQVARLLEALFLVDPERARLNALSLLSDPSVTVAVAAIDVLADRLELLPVFDQLADAVQLTRLAKSPSLEVRLRASQARSRLATKAPKAGKKAPKAGKSPVRRLPVDSGVGWATSNALAPKLSGLSDGVDLLKEALDLLARKRPDYSHFVESALRTLRAGTKDRVNPSEFDLEVACEGNTPQQLAHHLVHWALRVFDGRVRGLPAKSPRALAASVREEIQVLESLSGTTCAAARIDRTVNRALERRYGQ